MTPTLAVLALALGFGADSDEYRRLSGAWKVIAVFEDGRALTEHQVATEYVADGRLTVDGPAISFLAPGAFELRKLAFAVNPRAEPKTIDLIGTAKVGAKGIYLLAGDTLMICLPGRHEPDRPQDFGAASPGRVLLTLKRLPPGGAPPAPAPVPAPAPAAVPPSPPPAAVPPAPKSDDDLRKMLVGTWGHQSDEQLVYLTLNPDGTYNASASWKKGLKKAFGDEIRSSGSWKMVDGVLIATVTASTERHMSGQVVSYRVVRIGPTDMIVVDQTGRQRHEWRVR
jgi:uncharacterized protein (TIGR03067 family)